MFLWVKQKAEAPEQYPEGEPWPKDVAL